MRFEIANLRKVWRGIRQVFGDAAYEDYLRSQRRMRQTGLCDQGAGGDDAGAGERDAGGVRVRPGAGRTETAQPLTREEFYLDALRRRYSGVSRCC